MLTVMMMSYIIFDFDFLRLIIVHAILFDGFIDI